MRHPSALLALPSSHSSPVSRMPLPQTAAAVALGAGPLARLQAPSTSTRRPPGRARLSGGILRATPALRRGARSSCFGTPSGRCLEFSSNPRVTTWGSLELFGTPSGRCLEFSSNPRVTDVGLARVVRHPSGRCLEFSAGHGLGSHACGSVLHELSCDLGRPAMPAVDLVVEPPHRGRVDAAARSPRASARPGWARSAAVFTTGTAS